MTAAIAPYVLDLVRTHDRGRFVASLFAPPTARDRVLALLAFDRELARIPATVSEPMLGQMRFQWWRDLIARVADGGSAPQGHPVAQALAAGMSGISRGELDALIDAHEAALTEPEAAVEPAAAALSALGLEALGVADGPTCAAARDAAVAYGLAVLPKSEGRSEHVLAHVAAARSTGQVDRRAIPVLLWATLAEKLLVSNRVPTFTLTWRAWRGRY